MSIFHVEHSAPEGIAYGQACCRSFTSWAWSEFIVVAYGNAGEGGCPHPPASRLACRHHVCTVVRNGGSSQGSGGVLRPISVAAHRHRGDRPESSPASA